MNKRGLGTAIVAVLGLFIMIIVIVFIAGYNGLVDKDENVNSAFSQIDVTLAERYQKITSLVSTVNGLQDHAEDIYNAITEARAAYATASANKDVEGLIEADYLQSLALTDLIALVVSEDNPNISATPAYLTLMDEISSSEAELAYARRVYNLAVEDYNASVRRFPRIIIANMFSFDKERLYWKASDGELEIPEVVFND